MAGSRLPVVTAHGEGRAIFATAVDVERVIVAARMVDNRGRPTEVYPLNPNGSPEADRCDNADGRFTAFMPHPERVFRTVQLSWARRAGARTAPGCASSAMPACGSANEGSDGFGTSREPPTGM